MTREEATKKIKKVIEESVIFEDELEAFDMAIEALSRSEKPNKWIPASERLPEKATKVLASWVYVPTGAKYVEVTERYGDDDDCFFIGDTDEYKMNRKEHKVIAWMPLPEPYNAESEEV